MKENNLKYRIMYIKRRYIGFGIIIIFSLLLNLFFYKYYYVPNRQEELLNYNKPEVCVEKVMDAIDLIYPYDAENGFKCLQKSIKASQILQGLGYSPKIKMGLENIDGELKGHAWIDINGTDYWKGNNEWPIPYKDWEIDYIMGINGIKP